MNNIVVTRYPRPADVGGWQGYLEPEDKSWIMFVDFQGRPVVFLDRDPDTGAVRVDDTISTPAPFQTGMKE